MRQYINNMLLATATLFVLSGCDSETGFSLSQEEGQLNCRSLSIDYVNSGKQTRAVDTADFTVDFINADGEIVKSYLYAEMPEVVMLPVGEYYIQAYYGDNPVADWETPYYFGQSDSTFSIVAGEITDNVDPIECKLSNIRIMVVIDDLGMDILGDDAKVVVNVGDKGELEYDASKKSTAGYFRYVEGSQTITATFSGTVDGVYVQGVSKVYSDASAGNAYLINFTVSNPDNVEPGDIVIGDESSSGIEVDATITVKDENIVVDPNEPSEDVLDDSERPMEDPVQGSGGTEDPGEDEDDPSSGDDPALSDAGPKVTNMSDGLILNGSVDMDSLTECMFDVESATGIISFNIHIESGSLSPEELAMVGLAADMDLVNPGDLADPLVNLGFPVGDDVKGATSCHFDITTFLGLLGVLGPDEHKFHLTVTDAEGTLECYIGLIKN